MVLRVAVFLLKQETVMAVSVRFTTPEIHFKGLHPRDTVMAVSVWFNMAVM